MSCVKALYTVSLNWERHTEAKKNAPRLQEPLGSREGTKETFRQNCKNTKRRLLHTDQKINSTRKWNVYAQHIWTHSLTVMG